MEQSFEVELEALAGKFARELAEQVTALILRRLGIERPAAARPLAVAPRQAPAAPPAQPKGPPAKSAPAKSARAAKPAKVEPVKAKRRVRSTAEQLSAGVNAVERVVATEGGVSASDIKRTSGLSAPVIATALRVLKKEGRIFMGGTKRFARYATTQAAADKASRAARGADA